MRGLMRQVKESGGLDLPDIRKAAARGFPISGWQNYAMLMAMPMFNQYFERRFRGAN